jgi:shikimate dehydrogenase
VDVRSEAVRRTGACNTFWGDEEGRVHGDNTDVEGLRRALRAFVGSVQDMKVLLLGAGGAARAALAALLEDGVGEVVLLNRSPERARAVARRIGGSRARVAHGPAELAGQGFDLAINATRLGLSPDDPLPLDFTELSRVGAAMDLVYGKSKTPFVKAAETFGVRAADGAEMLVHQGAASFEDWWDRPAPLEAMRVALLKSLGR